ncbi:hypothetical protein [Nodularia chucula]|uniref:hypothetical protein n=1 Tax=Nodularia chucula TaxID=3093667 RepID=UPI0039C6E6AE
MPEVNQTEKLIGSILVAVILVVIIGPTLWNNYQQNQQRERARKTCEQLASIRSDIIRRQRSGDPTVTSLELGAAYQLGNMTGDCKIPKY